MAALQWSPALAVVAQAYAERCEFVNNPNHSYGENIAWGAYGGDISRVVASWADASSYTFSSNSCAAGKQCSSYIILVSASSMNLGCGQHTCGSNEIYVCIYDQSGTPTGSQPYRQGPAASDCPVGYSGVNGLCMMSASSNETTIMPNSTTTMPNSTMPGTMAPVNVSTVIRMTNEPVEVPLPGAGEIPLNRSGDQGFLPNNAKSIILPRGIDSIPIAMISLCIAAFYM
jgi:hypothetical protein